MHGRRPTNIRNKVVSLLILEGDTEQEFYPIIRDRFLIGIAIKLQNIKGQGNTNKDVLAEIYKYTYNNHTDLVRAYCCVDTEKQNTTATPLELDFVREQIRMKRLHTVLSVEAILADPDIESWFFYDIKGIYKFLRAPKSQRNIRKYANPKNLRKKDLSELFNRFGKVYLPGKRAKHFIETLDIEKIVSCCGELHAGINRISSQAHNMTNDIFASPQR